MAPPSNQADQFATPDGAGPTGQRGLAFALAQIIVRRAMTLEPFAPQSDAPRHSVQRLERVGQHVCHLHAAVRPAAVVHVDGH